MFASACASSFPDLRFDPLRGIVMSDHDVLQQVQRIDTFRGLDSVEEVSMGTEEDEEAAMWLNYGSNERPKLA